jgi:membrane fusion protein
MKLFRQEAIENETNRFTTGTTMVSPPGISAYVVFLAFSLTCVGLFVLFGKYAPKDTVRGYVTTATGDVEVYSQSDGTILALSVAEGQSVVEGQELMTLSTARAARQSAAARKAVVRALRSELSDLGIQSRSEQKAFDLQEETARQDIASLRERLATLTRQRGVLDEGLKLSERELTRLLALDAMQFVSKLDQDRARAAKVEFSFRMYELELAIDSVRSEIRRNEKLLAEIPVRREARAAEMRAQSQQLSVKITESNDFDTQRISAPSSGMVSGLLVREGQTISMNTPLLNIVPEHADFILELLIPSRTIGFVRPGARVEIRYDAYPYQKYGTFEGVIASISHTTVLPNDKRFRVRISEPVYLAIARIERRVVLVDGEPQTLQSGMTLTADILRDERRILEWIFDPLIGAAKRL